MMICGVSFYLCDSSVFLNGDEFVKVNSVEKHLDKILRY